MASRYRSRRTALLSALILVAGCSATGAPHLTSTSTSLAPTKTAAPTTTTTTTTPTTTTTTPTTTTVVLADFVGEVIVPVGIGPFPAVVLVHGGAWLFGSPSVLRPMAEYLADAGFLTVNTPYQLATSSNAGFPRAIDDVACAVRYAASHQSSDGTVTVIGHSAGAHIGAIVALNGSAYGGDCPYPGTGIPDRFVGMAGPYDVHALGILPILFFGGSVTALPDLWAAGNPLRLAAENPAPPSLVIHGELDSLVPAFFAESFVGALVDAGGTASFETVTGAYHNDLMTPSVTGELILRWLAQIED